MCVFRQTSSECHIAAVANLGALNATESQFDSSITIGTKGLVTLASAMHDGVLETCNEETNFAQWTREQFEEMTGTETLLTGLSKAMGQAMQRTELSLDKDLRSSEGAQGCLHTGVNDTATALGADMAAVDTQGTTFVQETIKRDTGDTIPNKAYTYPTAFARNPPYEKTLEDKSVAWSHETKITSGAVQPGKGADFPGNIGEEDWTGALDETKDIMLDMADAEALELAERESDDEEYDGEIVVDESDPHAVPKIRSLPRRPSTGPIQKAVPAQPCT